MLAVGKDGEAEASVSLVVIAEEMSVALAASVVMVDGKVSLLETEGSADALAETFVDTGSTVTDAVTKGIDRLVAEGTADDTLRTVELSTVHVELSTVHVELSAVHVELSPVNVVLMLNVVLNPHDG